MAIRFTRHKRPLLVVAALAAAATLTPTLAVATPAAPQPKPTLETVQKQLGQLAMKNSQLVDEFNQARLVVVKREQEAAAAQSSARRITARYQRSNSEFNRIVQAQYEAGSIGAAGALLDSGSGSDYLAKLDTLSLISSHDADVVSTVTENRKAAVTASQKAQDVLAAAKQDRDQLGSQRSSVQQQIEKYQLLLATLTLKQQQAFQNRANPVTSAADAAAYTKALPRAETAAARKAVAFAIKQVGKPYVFGAAGPTSYDCSGLTLDAWRQGGVGLPHSAADQFNYGHHVTLDKLKPGDLLFYYRPIGHVTIYIGSGMMVSAPTEGEPVQIVSVGSFTSDFTGATHLK